MPICVCGPCFPVHKLLCNINEVYSLAIEQSVLSLHGEHTVCSLPAGICSEYVLSGRRICAQSAVFKTCHQTYKRQKLSTETAQKTVYDGKTTCLAKLKPFYTQTKNTTQHTMKGR